MQQKIYDRLTIIEKNCTGYIGTKELLQYGLTNRQIGRLQEEGYLEKIVNGLFWLSKAKQDKPSEYKLIEVCLVNPNAVICAESACYIHGLIDVEPEKLSIATKRSDRHKMDMPFETSRHYYADSYFDNNIITVETAYGAYRIYDLERSISDCIRFKDEIHPEIYEMIISKHRKMQEDAMVKRMIAYAKAMKFEKKMREEIRKE
ncbi:MAG: type IV toxin-antitoxin system AbiEi family antitoxin domain-containing protein [Lachnospiraceae bacterium]|nr:type IV toxin-antitoxin system AbiEi family antitoxin domain-containing protein [Lachnospiraceae bacterium]